MLPVWRYCPAQVRSISLPAHGDQNHLQSRGLDVFTYPQDCAILLLSNEESVKTLILKERGHRIAFTARERPAPERL